MTPGKASLVVFLLVWISTSGCDRSPSRPSLEHFGREYRCPASDNCREPLCNQVLIPGGVFPMGTDRDTAGVAPDFFEGLDVFGDPTPRHDVFLRPYCIDAYEVSVERYEHCVQAGACDPGDRECSLMPQEQIYLTRVNHYPDYCQNHGELCPRYPVNCRTYQQAWAYCQWIGRRLCTEAEWERAASGPGPAKRTYPWGEEAASRERANTCIDGPGHLLPVDVLPAGVSAEGVYNLAGNVYEWVHDYYAPYRPSGHNPRVDPRGPDHGILRVGRGGCFLTESTCSSTERTTFKPSFDWG